MPFEIRRNPDGSPWVGPDGRMKMEFIPGAEDEPEVWPDQTCIVCGQSKSWFSTLRVETLGALCFECVTPSWARRSNDGPGMVAAGPEFVVLAQIVTALRRAAYGR
jgi:hypothetical protein